jgi:hypothetical protein
MSIRYVKPIPDVTSPTIGDLIRQRDYGDAAYVLTFGISRHSPELTWCVG